MLALRSQFDHCRFESYSYGWWDKKYRVMMFFNHFYKGWLMDSQCNGQNWPVTKAGDK